MRVETVRDYCPYHAPINLNKTPRISVYVAMMHNNKNRTGGVDKLGACTTVCFEDECFNLL